MKTTKEEFKRLQEFWYKQLSDQGFKDIEELRGNDLVLKQSALACFKNTDLCSIAIRKEYFRIMAQIVHDESTVFKNEIDKYILSRYAEGARIQTISDELRAFGSPKHRISVRFIIRRYEMKWGIKIYGRRQLNLKVR